MRRKISYVFVAVLLTVGFSGCAHLNARIDKQENVTEAVQNSDFSENEDGVRQIEFRLEYPQAMWQMIDLRYADFKNQEEFEREFYQDVEKIIEITGYKDWYKQYNTDMEYARVLIKMADMGYVSVGGKCDIPSDDTVKGIFTTIYLDKDLIAVGGQVLPHELTHFLCGMSFSFSLADGLAEYCDFQVTGKSRNYSSYPADDYLKAMEVSYQEHDGFNEEVRQEIMDSVGRAGQYYPYRDDSIKSPFWYVYSESFVTWLIRNYGMENFMHLYRDGSSEADYIWLDEGGFDAVKQKWYDYYNNYEPQYDYDVVYNEQLEYSDRWSQIRGQIN